MKNIINKISRAVQVLLLAPIKLPGKALNILKYVAVGLGVIESVLDSGKQESGIGDQEMGIGDQDMGTEDQKNKDQGSKLHAEGTKEQNGGGER